jgi:hypothetical protein
VACSFDDVRRVALALPGAEERSSRGRLQWRVGERLFVWERPLRAREVEELSDGGPDGPILGARVEHLIAKEALLASEPEIFFTTSHFDGHPSVLVRMDRIELPALEEVVVEAWLARAPSKAVKLFLSDRSDVRDD